MTQSGQVEPARARTMAGLLRERLKYSPRLLPDMFWTLVNHLLAAISGILIFKLVSRWIPANEYGQASLVLGFVGLLSQLIAGPVVLAHLRIYFEHAKEGLGLAYSRAVLRLLLRTAFVMSGIYMVIALIYLALHNHVYWSLALPAVLLLSVQTQLTGTLTFFEAEKRYRALAMAQSMSKVLQVPFLLLLVAATVSGSTAVVSSQVLAIGGVVLVWRVFSKQKSAILATEPAFRTRDIARSAARIFGWSLYLFNLFSWFLTTSDRYVIEHFWSAKEVGIYALNYGLWSVPYLSLNAWLEMLVRARIFERAEAKDWVGVTRLLRDRLALAVLLGTLLTAVIYSAGPWIAFRIIGEKYWAGKTLMMLICTAHFFYVIAASFHAILQALKRTHALMYIALGASITNVALNIVLVPRAGILGAGWSTFAAYAAACAITLPVGLWLLNRNKRDMIHARSV